MESAAQEGLRELMHLASCPQARSACEVIRVETGILDPLCSTWACRISSKKTVEFQKLIGQYVLHSWKASNTLEHLPASLNNPWMTKCVSSPKPPQGARRCVCVMRLQSAPVPLRERIRGRDGLCISGCLFLI